MKKVIKKKFSYKRKKNSCKNNGTKNNVGTFYFVLGLVKNNRKFKK